MRKKLIFTSILSVFLSLLLLLGVSVLVVDRSRKSDSEDSLRNYLAIAESYYDPDSLIYTPSATKELLVNKYSEVRLTIISESGTVRIDTSSETNENHLSRPEIQNLGTIYYRYSATLGMNMIYLAGKDLGSNNTADYVRVALPLQKVEKTTYQLALFGFLGILAITALSALLTYYLTKRSLKPLQKEVSALSSIVGEPSSEKDDVKELGEKVNKAKALLDQRYEEVEKEKQKYETLLDDMEQGLIALDSTGKAQIVNAAAASAFNSTKEAILGKDYTFLTTDEAFLTHIQNALREEKPFSFDYVSGAKTFLISLSPLGDSFQKQENSHGVSLLTLDVTEKRQLESAKRDFFANASHELKSPLTAIIGYQELLENGTISEEKDKEEALEATLKEARRMKEVIFQMLILSKLESETQKDKRPLPLKPLIEESLKEYDALIAKKKLKLITHLSDVQVPMASEDAHNLLANLIENGIKYNKDGGTLEITLDPAYFAIRDTGIGIATENQSRIYERFYRVDPAKSKELGGTGLGLSIVKHICLDYGFSIKLSSTLGLGTTFRVDFYPGKIK